MTEATSAQPGAGEGVAAPADTAAQGGNETILQNGADTAAQGEQTEQVESQSEGRARGSDGKFLPKTDWRDRLAGDDAQFRKRLDRFTDETAFAKSYRSLEQKLSSGELKRALPENATEDELKAWRKDNGIPDKPEAYVEALKLPNGIVPGETDKPLLDGFAKHAMERNWTPQQYNDAVHWYYANLDAQRAQQEQADADYRAKAEDELRGVWQGPDYRRNLTAVNNLMATWPEDVKVAVLAARDPEGRKLGDNPNFVRKLAELALELNPAATLVPTTSDHGKALETRLGELNKLISDRGSEYYRGPNSAALQKEYRDLLSAQERMKSRAA